MKWMTLRGLFIRPYWTLGGLPNLLRRCKKNDSGGAEKWTYVRPPAAGCRSVRWSQLTEPYTAPFSQLNFSTLQGDLSG